MKFALLALLVAVCGCSGDVVPVQESGTDNDKHVSYAVEQLLYKGEVVQSVALCESAGLRSNRPLYTVRVVSESETRGGREFRVSFDGQRWVAAEQSYRWVSFEHPGPLGIVKLAAPIDISTAVEVLEFVRPQLTDGEYVTGLGECMQIESGVNDKGEHVVSGASAVRGCVDVTIFRGPGFKGRGLGIDVLGDVYLVVRTSIVST